MIRRPKPGETEDDLLEFQRQFLATKSTPSATVVQSRPGDKRKTDDSFHEPSPQIQKDVVQLGGPVPSQAPGEQIPPVKKSKFKATQEKKAKSRPAPSVIEDPEEFIDEHDSSMAAVLTKIIERDTRNTPFSLPAQVLQPFPSVQKVKDISQDRQPGKKKTSLFAKHFEKAPEEFGITNKPVGVPVCTTEVMDTEDSKEDGKEMTTLIDGTGLSATFGKTEAKKIHEENIGQLSKMSQEDILVEQRKLLETLDPSLVDFLKTRKTKIESEIGVASGVGGTSKGGGAAGMEIDDMQGGKKKKSTVAHKEKDVDLPVEVKKDWVHMDKIEYDKLDWMKDLPTPSAGSNETGKQARFDFKGNLVLEDADIPVNVGLHHHGDEPERAGYTLEELFQLARSSNIQQRCLALNTLAKVIQQAKGGNLSQLIQTPILPSILDAGVVFLLRWSLDDSVDAVVIATVAAFNALLVNHADEMALDKVFHWHQGHRVVCQAPAEPEGVGIKLPDVADEKPQETDADIVKKDLISALVDRMSFLARLRYILDKVRPQAPTVIAILQILTRLVRHSTRLAYLVSNDRGLLDLIVKEFLPLTWSPTDPSQPLTNVYGLPLVTAMRLLRTLCQASRNITAAMVTRYNLRERLLRFLLTDVSDLQLPEGEGRGLLIEGWGLWRVCLSYSLCDTLYIEVYPRIVAELRGTQGVLDHPVLYQTQLTAMIGALEMAVCVGAVARRAGTFKHSQDGTSIEVERSEEVAMPTINWAHVADLIQPIKVLLKSLLDDVSSSYQIKKQSLQLPIACLNFVRTYYTQCQTQVSGTDMVGTLEEMEEVFRSCLQHWGSFGINTVKASLSKHSNLLVPGDQKNMEVSSCLPEYGNSSLDEDQFVPVTSTGSPVGFLLSYLSMVYQFCRIHKGLLSTEFQTRFGATVVPTAILNDTDFRTYLRKLGPGNVGPLAGNFFTKFETQLLYYFLKLATLPGQQETVSQMDGSLLHCVSLVLVTSLQAGDEHLVHDLLSTVTFNPIFWKTSEEDSTTETLQALRLSDAEEIYLRSATEEELHLTQNQLCAEVNVNLAGIRATYLASLGHSQKPTWTSRHHYLQNTMATETCFTQGVGECLMPKDWMFLPLIELYSVFASTYTEAQNVLSASEVDTIRNVLRWIYLLEVKRPLLLQQVSISLKLSRIMCTFLTGNDMFFDRTVHCYLAGLLHHYTKPSLLDKLDFSQPIPGLPSFYDLYISLLQQYEAVSFGDPLFGCYVLIPMQQRHSAQYRKAIWTEYTGILRTLSLPLSQLLIPISGYLEPEETNVDLLRRYYQCLYSGSLRHSWAPVLYLVAVHHVNRFMYTQDNRHRQLKATMISQLLVSKNEEIKQHLLYYKTASLKEKFGLELYEELPPIRQKYVDTFK